MFHATSNTVLVWSQRNWLLIRADGFGVWVLNSSLLRRSASLFSSSSSFSSFVSTFLFFFSPPALWLFKSVHPRSILDRFLFLFSVPRPILSTISYWPCSLELQIMQRTVRLPRHEFLRNYKSHVQTSSSQSTREIRFGEREASYCWFRQERIG